MGSKRSQEGSGDNYRLVQLKPATVSPPLSCCPTVSERGPKRRRSGRAGGVTEGTAGSQRIDPRQVKMTPETSPLGEAFISLPNVMPLSFSFYLFASLSQLCLYLIPGKLKKLSSCNVSEVRPCQNSAFKHFLHLYVSPYLTFTCCYLLLTGA